MLWVTVGVNENIIDRIAIHNTGNNKNGYWEYELLNPYTGKKMIEETIWHKRIWGYRPLLKQALTLLKKYNIARTEYIEDYFDKEEKD